MLQPDAMLCGIHGRDGAGAMRIGAAFMHHLNLAMAGPMPGMVHRRHCSGRCGGKFDRIRAARRCAAEIDAKRRRRWRIGDRRLGIDAGRKR